MLFRSLYASLALLVTQAGAIGHSLHNDAVLDDRLHYAKDFQKWMSEYQVTFKTRGEYERRLSIFIQNRYVYSSFTSLPNTGMCFSPLRKVSDGVTFATVFPLNHLVKEEMLSVALVSCCRARLCSSTQLYICPLGLLDCQDTC